MKGLLAALVLFQLLLLNEGILSKSKVKLPKKKIPTLRKSCPRNPKLDAFKKGLGLATKHGRQKRSLPFPIDCFHAAIFELNGAFDVHFDLHQCCLACHFPAYVTCLLNGFPDWLCASRAYKCMCECRETHLQAGHNAESLRKSSKVTSRKKATKADVCMKKKCGYAGKGCCVQNVCIPLFIHKKPSPVRQ